ncbi:hypothetical protein [Enterococcus hirae]|uniref:hypothetical protein n=1 Tax=Enterococcus hirae TaxID=1354 RepID=UPI00136BAF27|nr:hypothetical protein [Enterococcus hirae]NAE18287.1 hypothetical protein [Enterococcus hirae]
MSILGDLLTRTGGKTAKFAAIGDTITGTVISADVRQRTDLDTGKPATWDNGDPQNQVVITLQTELREDGDDDGLRSVYVKAWGQQMNALREAVRTSGAGDIKPGGTFTATYSGDGQKPKPHLSAPKLFTYRYEGPSGLSGLLGGSEQAPAETTATATPTAAPAPAAGGADPAHIATAKQLIAAGLDDAVILSAAPSVTPAVLAALRNTTVAA